MYYVGPRPRHHDIIITIIKVRKLQGLRGLALIRLKEGFAAQQLNIGQAKVTVAKPQWWPPEKEDKKING